MDVEHVATTPECAECEAVWLPADPERWRCYLDVNDKPVFFCPECARREFDDAGGELAE